METYVLPHLITPSGYTRNVVIRVDAHGTIVAREDNVATEDLPGSVNRVDDHLVALPGLVNAHSHAFQRLLRGPTQYRGPAQDSFWTWRKVMYQSLSKLTPEEMYTIARHLYLEMAASGVTHVGEFHYVHHQSNGAAHDDRLAMSKALMQAASDVGLRMTLLRTVYLRGDFDADPTPQQRRFIDPTLKLVEEDLEALLRYEREGCTVGIAPHSVRAVAPEDLRRLKKKFPTQPFHIHASEQVLENDGCHKHYGMTPIELLESVGCLTPSTVLVHATHVTDTDIQRVAEHGTQVCFCPSTEADLGDGLGPASAYLDHQISLSLGTDGQTMSSILEEARRLEMHERLRLQIRNALSKTEGESAGDICLRIATEGGSKALGSKDAPLTVGRPLDFFTIDRHDPFIAGTVPSDLLNAILFSIPSSHIHSTFVGGQQIASQADTTTLRESGMTLTKLARTLSEPHP